MVKLPELESISQKGKRESELAISPLINEKAPCAIKCRAPTKFILLSMPALWTSSSAGAFEAYTQLTQGHNL